MRASSQVKPQIEFLHPSRWTFEIVERFDDDYYDSARSEVLRLEQRLVDGRRHAHEEVMRQRRRSEQPPFLVDDVEG